MSTEETRVWIKAVEVGMDRKLKTRHLKYLRWDSY